MMIGGMLGIENRFRWYEMLMYFTGSLSSPTCFCILCVSSLRSRTVYRPDKTVQRHAPTPDGLHKLTMSQSDLSHA